MRIYKFGGASVKDATAVRNIKSVLEEVSYHNTVIVLSAMGKTTNAMEKVVQEYFEDKTKVTESLREIKDFHYKILKDLFKQENHPIYNEVQQLFEEIKGFLTWNKSPKHAFVYDQVIGYGELLSTTIISRFLNEEGIANTWIDVRDFIKTDNSHRDARVNWELTQKNIDGGISKGGTYITQGFWVYYGSAIKCKLYGFAVRYFF